MTLLYLILVQMIQLLPLKVMDCGQLYGVGESKLMTLVMLLMRKE
jgi:hypothetical protein